MGVVTIYDTIKSWQELKGLKASDYSVSIFNFQLSGLLSVCRLFLNYKIMKKTETYFELEASTVPVRFINKQIEFLIIYRKKLNDYTLPKGHLEQGESLEDAAKRETFEETGYKVKIINFLGSFEYKVNEQKDGKNVDIIRRVYNFSSEIVGGEADGKNIDKAEGDMEIFWLFYKEALQKVTYDNNKEFIEKAYGMYQKKFL